MIVYNLRLRSFWYPLPTSAQKMKIFNANFNFFCIFLLTIGELCVKILYIYGINIHFPPYNRKTKTFLEESKMLICPNCKKQFNTADTFCDVCGTRLAEMQPANGNQYQPQQPAPQYQQPAPQYQQPAPQYQQPAPQYQQPAPQYQQPAPQYQQAPYGAPNGAPKGPNPFVAFFTNLWSKLIALPKKWLIAGGSALAALILIVILVPILLAPPKPNFDLKEAENNLEDKDYTVNTTEYKHPEDSNGRLERLSATSEDGESNLEIVIFDNAKLANLYYEECKLEREAKIYIYEMQIKAQENELKELQTLLSKYGKELSSSEIDDLGDEIAELLSDIKEAKADLKELKNESVVGKSGKKVWAGTKDAIKDSKK